MIAAIPAVIGAWIGTKSLKIVGLIAGLTAVTAALALVIGGFLNALQVAIPQEFGLCIGMMPSNATACLSALLVASGARWVYDTHSRVMIAAVGA